MDHDNDTRRMHTVPASYLGGFAITERRRTPAVWRYSRSEQDPISIGIYDAAVWKDIYAFDDETGQKNIGIEHVLKEIDGSFCHARKSLETHAPLTIAQRHDVALFISFQLLRTPRSLQLHRDEFARYRKDEVLDLAADKERFHVAMEGEYESANACEVARSKLLSGGWHYEAEAFTGLHAMMHIAANMALWIVLMDWTAFTSDGTYKLVTSDNPVTQWADRVTGGQAGTEVGLGFADPEMRLSFPITPLISLVAEHTPLSLAAVDAEDPNTVRETSRKRSPQLRYKAATPNHLKILNHATVTNADRYVFHCERDPKVELFLSRYFWNQPAPVRRCDRKPIGTST